MYSKLSLSLQNSLSLQSSLSFFLSFCFSLSLPLSSSIFQYYFHTLPLFSDSFLSLYLCLSLCLTFHLSLFFSPPFSLFSNCISLSFPNTHYQAGQRSWKCFACSYQSVIPGKQFHFISLLRTHQPCYEFRLRKGKGTRKKDFLCEADEKSIE